VATDILGATGRIILTALVSGNQDAETLAECAKGSLRRKRAELVQALQGQITDHQRFMLRELIEDLEYVQGKIARMEATIQLRMAPHEEVLGRLNTIPGVNRLAASTLIAELGVQMQQFPDSRHLASWAGLCPGDCESAGKRKNTRTRKRDPHLRRILCQAARAAAHTKRTYLAALFYRIAAKGGRKKALIALSRHLIVIAYHLIREPVTYRDLGEHYFDTLHTERTKQRLVRRLESLGHQVVLQPKPRRPDLYFRRNSGWRKFDTDFWLSR
jgi:transposase